jgi:histidinol-phosphate aminotransferase
MIRPRDDVALMEGYHSPQVSVAVRLNTNESPTAPPSAWQAAYEKAVGAIDWHRYPDRAATDLRAAIARLHGVDPAQVFVANGSNEVLQTVLLTYGGAGRTAAMWEPTYALHAHISRITGTTVVQGERAPDLSTDLDEVRRVLAEAAPSVVFLCSPNNPTGMVDDEVTVRAVLDLVVDRGALLVVDEAYGQFAPWSALGLVGDDVPLVVTRTFSKTWSMAAARLGYLVGPAEVVAQLDQVVLPYHLDTAKQLAGTLALDYVDEMNERVAHLVEERGRLVTRLADLPVDLWPSGANFVLFRPRPDARVASGHDLWQALLERSILVRDFSSMPRLDDCLRVTIGTPDENDLLLDALTEILT